MTATRCISAETRRTSVTILVVARASRLTERVRSKPSAITTCVQSINNNLASPKKNSSSMMKRDKNKRSSIDQSTMLEADHETSKIEEDNEESKDNSKHTVCLPRHILVAVLNRRLRVYLHNHKRVFRDHRASEA